jgi:hypothetical protein
MQRSWLPRGDDETLDPVIPFGVKLFYAYCNHGPNHTSGA